MDTIPDNESRTRILNAAEELFAKRGYAAVRLRDIAGAVGMHHASLYYYAPKGKVQLYIEVMERTLQRHRTGMESTIVEAGDDFRAQLHAVARWLALQPPMDLARMTEVDLREVAPEAAERLMVIGYEALRDPIVAVLQQAQLEGAIAIPDLDFAALSLISLIQSVHAIPGSPPPHAREWMARGLVELLLNGLLVR